jgi:stearoyl-CoA desaturase (delta-9 desaturase)
MSFLLACGITVVILQLSVLYTTIYLHRALTHRGLDLHPAVRGLMHLHLALFTGIVPREWAAVHRKHHHFSDQPGDPHSPYLDGLWRVFWLNFWLYRKEARNLLTVRKYTPDYHPTWVDRIPWLPYWGIFAGLAIFVALFGWIGGLAAWLFHIVAYILLNASINSFCHMVGYRNFDNKATNIRWVALITGGEGLHNNHHEFPSSPKLAVRRMEIDPAWPVIRLLEIAGLARVKRAALAKAA